MSQPDLGNGQGRVWEYPVLEPLPAEVAQSKFVLGGDDDIAVTIGIPAEYTTTLDSTDDSQVDDVLGTVTFHAPGIADWDVSWEQEAVTGPTRDWETRELHALDPDTLRAHYGPFSIFEHQKGSLKCRLTVTDGEPGRVLGISEVTRGLQVLARRDYEFRLKGKTP